MFITLGVIAYQDFKNRMVWWFLYPLLGIIGGYFYYEQTFDLVYLYSVGLNFVTTLGIILLVWLYVKIVIKKPFLKEAFGLGDIFLLVAFSFLFPTLSFFVFLFFSILFSIAIHLILRSFRITKTAPLAGYMALFLIGVYGVSWSGMYQSLYLL
ncbi:MAG: general secretion pathway protein [Flavobacteriaceae bacterium]|nr:general secretion pathway protein [Flavobacteriaceae bacterium]